MGRWIRQLDVSADVGAISSWIHDAAVEVKWRRWETEETAIELDLPVITAKSESRTSIGFPSYLFTKSGYTLSDGTHRPPGSGQQVGTPFITIDIERTHATSSRVTARCYEPNLIGFFDDLLAGLGDRFACLEAGSDGEFSPTTHFTRVGGLPPGPTENAEKVQGKESSRAALTWEGQRKAVQQYWSDKEKGLFDDSSWNASDKRRMTQERWAREHYSISGRTLRRYVKMHFDLNPSAGM